MDFVARIIERRALMTLPTTLSTLDPLTLSTKMLWEDPCMILERALEVRAQGGPPGGGPPEGGLDRGFLGPLSASGGSGYC